MQWALYGLHNAGLQEARITASTRYHDGFVFFTMSSGSFKRALASALAVDTRGRERAWGRKRALYLQERHVRIPNAMQGRGDFRPGFQPPFLGEITATPHDPHAWSRGEADREALWDLATQNYQQAQTHDWPGDVNGRHGHVCFSVVRDVNCPQDGDYNGPRFHDILHREGCVVNAHAHDDHPRARVTANGARHRSNFIASRGIGADCRAGTVGPSTMLIAAVELMTSTFVLRCMVPSAAALLRRHALSSAEQKLDQEMQAKLRRYISDIPLAGWSVEVNKQVMEVTSHARAAGAKHFKAHAFD